jgi:hypothetical protein
MHLKSLQKATNCGLITPCAKEHENRYLASKIRGFKFSVYDACGYN